MFGNTLRLLRKKHGITQLQLAEILNLDASTISKYEKTDVTPSADVLLKMAQHFGVSTDFLLGYDNEKKMPSSNDESIKLLEQEVELLKNFRELTIDQQEFIIRAVNAEAERLANKHKK